MGLLEKYSCIFCKYRKLNKNHDYACMDSWEKDDSGYPIGKCNSLSNIYYGKIAEHFPFKQIDDWRTERTYKKEEKYNEAMDEKYGDCDAETDFSNNMDDNGLDKYTRYDLFMGNPCINMVANSIENLYTNFKIFVDGFCSQNIAENESGE